MIRRLLIANRGEIAVRIIRTARAMGITTIAVYSDADAHALHVRSADHAIRIGPASAAESYLNVSAILDAAAATQADAIHPGYGFLSENPDFVDALTAKGLTFIGPPADAIRKMGLKDAAKRLMEEAGVPVVPGYHGPDQSVELLAAEAARIGYPVLIKARAGGGGKGMRRVDQPDAFAEALAAAQREGQASFGDSAVLIEKYITTPRHIEVQVFGDSQGNVVHLYERDCTLQRRHQKVIEEAPAPGMTDALRTAMTEAAIRAAQTIGYVGAGTVEFIVDGAGPLRPDGFWFMEMNTRLQVEHPVTEAITGQDLVAWQLQVAAGAPLPLRQDQIPLNGHAMEARLYAEDPATGFLPSTGTLTRLAFGPARIDSGVEEGDEISPHYDPMIAKMITHGPTRDAARHKLETALANTHVAGITANTGFLRRLTAHAEFRDFNADTGLIARDLDLLTAPPAPNETAHAIAAWIALGITTDPAEIGWQHWGHAHATAELDPAISVLLPGGPALSFEGTRLTQISRDGPNLTAVSNGQRITADIAEGAEAISVQTGGEIHVFARLIRDASASGPIAHPDQITAPMTGTVTAILTAPGQTVSEGTPLLTMEAMKMEMPLIAPRDGTVATIPVATGAAVASGTLLLTLESTPND